VGHTVLRHEENQIGVYSDHSPLDARSLAMHALIAKKLLVDPVLIDQARSTLARWRAQAGESVAVHFAEWERILAGSPEAIAEFLTSPGEDATRLRQSSPFTNVLTPDERLSVYADFR